jgi:hypothetical protein
MCRSIVIGFLSVLEISILKEAHKKLAWIGLYTIFVSEEICQSGRVEIACGPWWASEL